MAGQKLLLCLAVTSCCLAPVSAGQDDVAEMRKQLSEFRALLEAQNKAHDAEVAQLRARIEELEKARRPPTAASQPGEGDGLSSVLERVRADAKARTAQPGWLQAVQNFNPEISVIGDFVGHADSREGGDLDEKWLFREVEIGISGSVDPFARADVFLGIHRSHEHAEHEEHEEDAEHAHAGSYELHVEEAYLTLLTLPCDLQAKVGKFRAGFGKVNTLHMHALPWVEYPLVIRNFFGEEGLAGEGVSISWLVPNPWDKYVELTYETFNNDDPHLFAGEEGDDFVHLLHLKTFHDLSAGSTLEAGFSAAVAPNNEGHGGRRTWLEGADLTYKWRDPRQGLYRSFLWQTEVIAAQKELEDRRVCSMGLFSAAEYQFARQWLFGGRYDFSELPDDAGLKEHAWSAYLTFLQSEYCFWRFGYQYSRRNFEVDGEDRDHQVFLQLNFGLGPHRAHKY